MTETAKPFDPRSRVKPNYPYAEFVKVKRFTSASNPTPEEIAVPVFINLDTGHREISSFNNLRIQGKMKLIGYGNLDHPKFNQIRQLMDTELHNSPKVEEYVSLMQQKVAKETERAKERSIK